MVRVRVQDTPTSHHYEEREVIAHQLAVTADGIGDHLMGLAIAQHWREANPKEALYLVARNGQERWLALFEGHEHLTPLLLPDLPLVHDVASRGGKHYVEACAGVPCLRPILRPLPAKASAWAEQYRDAVVLAPWAGYRRPGAPEWAINNRVWLPSHWLYLERLLHATGRRTVVIDTDHERNDAFTGAKVIGQSPQHVAALMRVASCVVSNESGMAHLAGALGVPCVVLSGPLDARKVHGGWSSVKVMQGPLPCSGCRWTGPHWRSACDTLCASLQAIQPVEVLARIEQTLAGWEGILRRLDVALPAGSPLPRADRRDTFRAFLDRAGPAPYLVETGCMRQADDCGAGMSTLLFGRYLAERGGRLTSVDNDAGHVALARREAQGLPVDVIEGDSVAWLRDYRGRPLSGLYLDAVDTYVAGFAEHALAEAVAGLPHLAPHAPILLDDTFRRGRGWEGKGGKAVPWLLAHGWRVARSEWQTLLVR